MHDFFKNIFFFGAEIRPTKRVDVSYRFSGHLVKGQDHTAGLCTNVFRSISFDALHLTVAKLCAVDAPLEGFPDYLVKCHSQSAGLCTTVVR